jgi:hypothetical protein
MSSADPGPVGTEPEQGNNRSNGSLVWLRAALLLLLLNTTLFYGGCKYQEMRFTVGPVAPFVTLAVDEDDWWPSRILGGSSLPLVVNLAVQTLAVVIIWRALPRLAQVLVSRSFLAATAISVLAMNAYLFCPWIWLYVVFWPTLHIQSAVCKIFLETPRSPDDLYASIASRLYFLVLLPATYGLVRATRFLMRRYLLVDPNRWWQFRLSGFMAVAVLLGTMIGMVVRLIVHDQ